MDSNMKAYFKSSMRYIYPHGIDSPVQMRDMIRVYLMVWFDVLMANGLRETAEKYIEECKVVAKPDWWPDETWKWW